MIRKNFKILLASLNYYCFDDCATTLMGHRLYSFEQGVPACHLVTGRARCAHRPTVLAMRDVTLSPLVTGDNNALSTPISVPVQCTHNTLIISLHSELRLCFVTRQTAHLERCGGQATGTTCTESTEPKRHKCSLCCAKLKKYVSACRNGGIEGRLWKCWEL